VPSQRPYVAFYNNRRYELFAESALKAQELAAKYFRASKSYQIAVVLADIEHQTSEF
jgi:hypothetical protein